MGLAGIELVDVAHDLGETTNVAAWQPERVRALAARLTRHLRSAGAQMPIDKTTCRAVPWPSEAPGAGR
jgi:hypothetical protein